MENEQTSQNSPVGKYIIWAVVVIVAGVIAYRYFRKRQQQIKSAANARAARTIKLDEQTETIQPTT